MVRSQSDKPHPRPLRFRETFFPYSNLRRSLPSSYGLPKTRPRPRQRAFCSFTFSRFQGAVASHRADIGVEVVQWQQAAP